MLSQGDHHVALPALRIHQGYLLVVLLSTLGICLAFIVQLACLLRYWLFKELKVVNKPFVGLYFK